MDTLREQVELGLELELGPEQPVPEPSREPWLGTAPDSVVEDTYLVAYASDSGRKLLQPAVVVFVAVAVVEVHVGWDN